MPSGSRKSSVFEEVMRPIQTYEEALVQEMVPAIAKAEARYAIARRTVQCAITIGHYAMVHARAAYGMMEPALQLLVEHGFLALQAPATQEGKPGRPAGPSYAVNPRLYTLHPYAQNPQKGVERGSFESFEDFEIKKTALTMNETNPSSTDDGDERADDFDEVTI